MHYSLNLSEFLLFFEDRVRIIRFSVDGRYLIFSYGNGYLKIYDLNILDEVPFYLYSSY